MVVLLVALVLASLALWVGVPLLWLWVGSLVQSATDDVGAAIGAMIFGVVVTIVLWIPVLAGLTRAYQRARTSRGLEDTGGFPLEVTMTCSAMVAIAAVTVWFLFGGGARAMIFGQ